MSLITGNTKQIVGVATDALVKFRAQTMPVFVGNAVIVPDEIWVKATVTGEFSVTLLKGDYEVSVPARNGQVAKFTINVPDDGNTYSWEQRVTSLIPAPAAPVGGAQPTASPSVLGITKVDSNVASPVAVTGFFQGTNLAALRGFVVTVDAKRAWLTAPEAHVAREWWYDATSLAVDDDGLSVVKPANVDVAAAGRWLAW